MKERLGEIKKIKGTKEQPKQEKELKLLDGKDYVDYRRKQ